MGNQPFNFDELVESEKDIEEIDEEQRELFDLELLAYLRYHGIID